MSMEPFFLVYKKTLIAENIFVINCIKNDVFYVLNKSLSVLYLSYMIVILTKISLDLKILTLLVYVYQKTFIVFTLMLSLTFRYLYRQ